MSASIQSSHEPWTEFYRNCGLDLNPSGIDQEEVDAIEPSVQFQESLDFVRNLSDHFTELKEVLNPGDIESLQMIDYSKAANIKQDRRFYDEIHLTNKRTVKKINSKILSVIERLSMKFCGPEGQRALYFSSRGVEFFRSSGRQVDEKLHLIFEALMDIGPFFKRIRDSHGTIVRELTCSYRYRSLSNSTNSNECIVDIQDHFRLMLKDANRMQRIIYEMDNSLDRIAERPPQAEEPILSSEESVSAAANQGFFQSICGWLSDVFESIYHCLFASFGSSEG